MEHGEHGFLVGHSTFLIKLANGYISGYISDCCKEIVREKNENMQKKTGYKTGYNLYQLSFEIAG